MRRRKEEKFSTDSEKKTRDKTVSLSESGREFHVNGTVQLLVTSARVVWTRCYFYGSSERLQEPKNKNHWCIEITNTSEH